MIERDSTDVTPLRAGATFLALALVAFSGVTAGDSPAQLRKSGLHERFGYHWPYATGPYYSDAGLAGTSGRLPGEVITPVGSFVLPVGELPFAPELKTTNRLAELRAQYFFVQSENLREVRQEIRTRILDAGGAVVAQRPSGTIVARLNLQALASIEGASGLLHIEPYHPAFKLHPAIGRTPLRDPVRAASEVYDLDVMIWEGEDGDAVAASLSELGVQVQHVWGDQLRIEAHRSLLTQIARLEPVRMIFEALPRHVLAEETTTTVQTGQYNLGATPYHDAGIDGSGSGIGSAQILMVLDTGIQLDAPELSDARTSAGLAGPAHRKVRVYQTTNAFGGQGDLLGCDAPVQGGVTHGHVVSSIALGNASLVPPEYGSGFYAADPWGGTWKLDGVAPGALLVAYDAQYTPPGISCDDPFFDTLDPGDLYNPGTPTDSSLGQAYMLEDARIVNFSWGSISNIYGADALDIDTFMLNHPETLVFVAAGNSGRDIEPPGGDGVPDGLTLSSPATTKSGLAIGASFNADTADSPNSRLSTSSVGPAVDYATNYRIAPQLMAPGGEPDGGGDLGMRSEFACRTSDNDQSDPVECDVVQGLQGTSMSAPAAAGAALLVRDYFNQGFYPTRVPNPGDSVATSSGALVKAILAASAEFMTGENLTKNHRWNNEQGYGRIQLDNVLPLENWPASPTGMIVHDTLGGVSHLSLPGTINIGGSASADFEVCNDEEELRIVLAWTDYVDPVGDLLNDLNLTLTSPSGKEYRGNYFSDDNNRNGIVTPGPFMGEDCPPIGSRTKDGLINEGAWSLPVCNYSKVPGLDDHPQTYDSTNPIEGIFLSPDADGNGQIEDGSCDAGSSEPGGTDGLGRCGNDLDCASDPWNPLSGDYCVGGTQQPEIGTWTVQLSASGTNVGTQVFALVVTGGACQGSAVQWDRSVYPCTGPARVVVTESDDVADSECNLTTGCSESTIASRTTVRVYDETDTQIDCEGLGCVPSITELVFEQLDPDLLVFASQEIATTDLALPTPGNGVLDVRDGYLVEVSYDDSSVMRISSAAVDCGLAIVSDTFVQQFGQDSSVLVQGGCERAPQRHERCVDGSCSETGGGCSEDVDCPLLPVGFFEYGYPDRYMDAGEFIHLDFAFSSGEMVDLHDVWAELRCVRVDADSPVGCRPGGAGCDPSECGGECDPLRENNLDCWDRMTILDSPKRIGALPAGATTSVSFAVQMATEEALSGSQTVELVLEIHDTTAGRSAGGVVVSRQRLNVDEITTYYNTDFPTGGVEVVFDLNNNERQDDPITDPVGLDGLDFRFETRSYGDLTTGLDENGIPVSRNQNLLSPWNFDGNGGGFTGGLASVTDAAGAQSNLIANTGEDKNFNGIEDGVCFTDPSIACYSFPLDPRCPGSGSCFSIENNNNDSNFTPVNHNQKGGCGWQTLPEYECTGISERGCVDDSDCLGTCQLFENSILSTFEPCSGASCPTVQQCNADTSTINFLGPCVNDVDCGGTPGSCENVNQTCVNDAGICSTTPATAGGVLHTGIIGNIGIGDCLTAQCRRFKVITTNNAELVWWSLWLTPVIEKVDQSVGPDGLPSARVEITQWAWNQSIDLPDENAAVSWEFDTDVDSIFPVDLVSDGEALNLIYGPFGPVTHAAAPGQVGEFGLFAPMGSCSDSGGTCRRDTDCPPGNCTGNPGIDCHVDAECSFAGAGVCTGADSCTQSNISINGSDPQGNNRVGQNSCFFEGPGTIPAGARDELSLALPPDDDLDNDGDAFIDEFVTAAGPIRNTDVTSFGGPDMRLDNLEDLYGTTGNRFQGAIGLVNLEGKSGSPANQGYGLAVDDMYVEWREIALNGDFTSCKDTVQVFDGACATLEVPTSYVYEGGTDLTISLLDRVPYNSACNGGANSGSVCYAAPDCPAGSCVQATNDCDLNGFFLEPGDDDDCDDNGIPDVVVRASSETTGDSEIVVLNQVNSGLPLYRGVLSTSLIADSPGVLHLQKIGAMDPTVSVTYLDLDDGTDRPCLNSPFEEQQGRIQASATVVLTSCDLVVTSTTVTDNGDGDTFADTDETVTLDFTVRNDCGIELTGCTAQLSTNSEWIECVRKPQVALGDLPVGGSEIASPEGFEFKVDSLADRTTQGLWVWDEFDARFSITFACREFDTLRVPQEVVLPLDLNLIDDGQIPVTWLEDFEAGGSNPSNPLQGTAFTAENLDQGIPGGSAAEGLSNADGWRCQYNDPDWVNSSSYHREPGTDCYPGLGLAHANAVFWQVDGSGVTGTPDGGRSYRGMKSMYYGVFLSQPDNDFTTPMAVVESVVTNPINLGVGNPKLSFWHQISLADYRLLDELSPLRSADRAVVQIQVMDGGNSPVTAWRNLVPVQNGYDEQAGRLSSMCTFDPIDDGTFEEDFFDPTDPDRDLGPSSTCYPGFSFGYLGDTDESFDMRNVGNATTQPAFSNEPTLGLGTWVESAIDLSRYRGQRARIRFLVSAAKSTHETWYGQLQYNLGARDDGWWIDDVTIDETLANPAQLVNDDFTLGTCSDNGAACIGQCEDSLISCSDDSDCGAGVSCVLPCPVEQTCTGTPEPCGPTCTSVMANLLVEPGELVNPEFIEVPAPGWLVSFNAESSMADACLDGTLQFRFCASTDADCDDFGDELLRGWTDNAQLSTAPQYSGDYAVEVRCSSDPTCRDSRQIGVDVDCGDEEDNMLNLVGVRAVDENTLTWPGEPLDIDVWTSIALTSSAQLDGTEETGYPGFFTNFVDATSISMSESPSAGQFHCYLAKKRMELVSVEGFYYCNSKSWRSGGHGEIPESPGTLPATGRFGDEPQSPIGRDRVLRNAIWGDFAPGKSSSETVREETNDDGRRILGRRGG